jgi:hypothetical protein
VRSPDEVCCEKNKRQERKQKLKVRLKDNLKGDPHLVAHRVLLRLRFLLFAT